MAESAPATVEEGVARIRALLAAAEAYHAEHDVEGEWLDEFGSLDGWENEVEHDASAGRIEALRDALAALGEEVGPLADAA